MENRNKALDQSIHRNSELRLKNFDANESHNGFFETAFVFLAILYDIKQKNRVKF